MADEIVVRLTHAKKLLRSVHGDRNAFVGASQVGAVLMMLDGSLPEGSLPNASIEYRLGLAYALVSRVDGQGEALGIISDAIDQLVVV